MHGPTNCTVTKEKKKRQGGFNILTSPKKLHAFVTEETK